MIKRKQPARVQRNQLITKARIVFDELNKRHFKGKLKPVPVTLTEKDDFKAAIFYKPNCMILLSLPFLVTASEYEFEQVILHEMIHYFFYFFNIKDASSILTGHSPRFRKMAKRLGMNIYH